MGPLKVTALLITGLAFLYGLALSDNPWLIFMGGVGFMLFLFLPNDL